MLRGYECRCSSDRMLLAHHRNYGLGMDAAGPGMLLEHERNYGLGVDAAGPSMLLEHERNYGLGVDAAGPGMLLEHERNYALGMDAAGPRMLLKYERNYGLGMGALVTVCWMLFEPSTWQAPGRFSTWDGHNGRTASEACRRTTGHVSISQQQRSKSVHFVAHLTMLYARRDKGSEGQTLIPKT